MKSMLKKHQIQNFKTYSGLELKEVTVSFQTLGRKLNDAPIVILNHALTGNSDILNRETGWWRALIGDGKLFDTTEYTIIVFNILGNGYDGELIDDYKSFTVKDIAKTWQITLDSLNVDKVYAMVGGSLGGSIAWEFAALRQDYLKNLIPIATDVIPSNWLIAFTFAQESILLNSKKPLEDARKMAMLFYRNPNSFSRKFKEKIEMGVFAVESWLDYHGELLNDRYSVKAYLMMNHLMKTVNVGLDELKKIDARITQIGVSSDFLYPKDEILKTKLDLEELNIENDYFEIKSFDGHDAFLIEQKQITKFLTHLF